MSATRKPLTLLWLLIFVLLVSVSTAAAEAPTEPLMLQDFESQPALEDTYQATATIGDVAQTGVGSLASTSTEGEWHTVAAELQNAPVDISEYGQLCFWVYDTTAAGNTVGVKLVDAAGKATERWTDNKDVGKNPKSAQNEWTFMCLNLMTYTGMDLKAVKQIQFTMFAAGVYYFDEISAQIGVGNEEVKPTVPTTLILTPAQGFEADNTFYSDYQADVSLGDVAHSGKTSLMATYAEGEWHAFGAYPDTRPMDVSGFDAVCFWIYDTTANNDGAAANTVGVSLIDAAGAKSEIWTDNADGGSNPKTVKDEWVRMCVNLSAYTGIDMTQIDKIQFALYWAGTYYVDDISFGIAIPDPAANFDQTTVQAFDAADTFYSDYQADVSLGDVAHSGSTSLMATYAEGEWHAFGAYPDTRPLDVSGYDAVCFWIYDTTANNDGAAANTVGVSLIDATGAKSEVWTDNADGGENAKTVKDEWVQMCINLSAYTGIDMKQIDKVQFALYWAGTYYVDDISFGKRIVDPAAGLTLTTVQGFDAEDTFYSDYQADVSLGDIALSGKTSLKATYAEGEWHAFGAYPDPRPLDASGYDAVCFWIYDTTANNDGAAANTVGVSLIDATGAKSEIWTDNADGGPNNKTVKDEWTQMCIQLSAYTGIDMKQIDKIQFALYWAGTYYVDDIAFGTAAK